MGVYLSPAIDTATFLKNISVLACSKSPETEEYADLKKESERANSKVLALFINSICLTVLFLIGLTFAPPVALGGLALAGASWAGLVYSHFLDLSLDKQLTEKQADINKIFEQTTRALSIIGTDLSSMGLDGPNVKLTFFASLWKIAENTTSDKDLRNNCGMILFRHGSATREQIQNLGIRLA